MSVILLLRVALQLTLQDLEILYVGVLSIDVELDSAHRDINCRHRQRKDRGRMSGLARTEDRIVDLTQRSTVEPWLVAVSSGEDAHCRNTAGTRAQAVHSPCSTLFDLGDIELEKAVQPMQKFLPLRTPVSRVS